MYLLVNEKGRILTFNEYKKINDCVVLLYGDEIIGNDCYLVMMLEKHEPTESKYKLYIADENMDLETIKKYNGNYAEVINKFKDKTTANSNELVVNWIEEYETIQCAKRINKNTTIPGLRCWVNDMIANVHVASTEKEDYLYLYDAFRYISKDEYDTSDFEFYEQPHDLVYVFYNKKTDEMFDIVVEETDDNFTVYAAFINDECMQENVSNIRDAIEGYKNSTWTK